MQKPTLPRLGSRFAALPNSIQLTFAVHFRFMGDASRSSLYNLVKAE